MWDCDYPRIIAVGVAERSSLHPTVPPAVCCGTAAGMIFAKGRYLAHLLSLLGTIWAGV